MKTEPAVDLACQHAGISRSELSRRLGEFPQTIEHWRTRGIPGDKCPAVAAATGVQVEHLRPDLNWQRDASGVVVGYLIPVSQPAQAA